MEFQVEWGYGIREVGKSMLGGLFKVTLIGFRHFYPQGTGLN